MKENTSKNLQPVSRKMIAEKAGTLNLQNIACQNNVMKRKLACNVEYCCRWGIH